MTHTVAHTAFPSPLPTPSQQHTPLCTITAKSTTLSGVAPIMSRTGMKPVPFTPSLRHLRLLHSLQVRFATLCLNMARSFQTALSLFLLSHYPPFKPVPPLTGTIKAQPPLAAIFPPPMSLSGSLFLLRSTLRGMVRLQSNNSSLSLLATGMDMMTCRS